MQPETVASIFSVCLLVGIVGGFGLFAYPRTRSAFVAATPKVATVVAVASTAGSLYFSEWADFVPCELCWYQRIAMYSMALILPVALVRSNRSIMNEAFVLAAAGLVVSAYHVQAQWFPETSNSCAIDNPCSATWVEGLGLFTIPQMAGMSFFLIVMLSIASTFGQTPDA